MLKIQSQIQLKIYNLIERVEKPSVYNHIFAYSIITIIILNVIAIILESYQGISSKYGNLLSLFEVISVIIFTIEYALRIFVAPLKYPSYTKVKSVKKFIFSPLGLIDLFAILPFYIPMLIPFDLRFLRMFRVIRLFSILKLSRYTKSINLLGNVLKEKKSDLMLIIFVIFIFLLVSSTIMFYIENEAQPDKFPNIIDAFWWAIATLTTVGYGDVYPITGWGKVLGGIIALLGIGMIALPTGIISVGYIERLSKAKSEKKQPQKCSHCGKEID